MTNKRQLLFLCHNYPVATYISLLLFSITDNTLICIHEYKPIFIYNYLLRLNAKKIIPWSKDIFTV